MTSEDAGHTDPLLDLMVDAHTRYTSGAFDSAARTMSKVWVGTYEAVHVAHDMIPLTALLLFEMCEDFPTVSHPDEWWCRAFNNSLDAVASLCRESLDRL